MRKYDWKRHGVEHLERARCIVNIREGLFDRDDRPVTSVETIPDIGWELDGTRVIHIVNGAEEDEKEPNQKA